MSAVRWVALLGLVCWLWLAVLRGMFWRTDVRLPVAMAPPGLAGSSAAKSAGDSAGDSAAGSATGWPAVAIVVPARDEAPVLPISLPSLVGQRYPGPVHVILADDGSTDGTGELVAREWPAVTVVQPGPPPVGWAGKLWALRAGIEAAGDVEFLLLTDADVEHRPDSLAALVAAATGYRLDLVSQMARLRVQTGWERLLVPAFVYFFALLYPFRWSNRPGHRTAAAAGGCCLVRRDALERAGGLAAIGASVIDDVALARLLKRAGGRTWLGLADQVDSVRPYPSLGSLWRMVSRSAYAQLRHSLPLLAGTVLGLALVFLVPPAAVLVGLVTGDLPTLLLGVAAWLLMAGTFVPMLRYYRQPWPAAFALPVTATLYLAMTIDSAVQHYRGRGAAWKGRTYPAPNRSSS